MSGSEYWRGVWQSKASEPIASVSGRSNYDARQVNALVIDAAIGLDLQEHDSLLDIGCAAGLMGEHLRNLVGSYVGVDYSEGALRRFDGSRVCASASSLPFREGSFSKTLMSSVLLCMTRQEAEDAIREMRRVTKDGGLGFCSGNLDKAHWNDCPVSLRQHYDDALWFQPEEFVELCLRLGWRKAEIVSGSGLLPQSAWMFDCRLEA